MHRFKNRHLLTDIGAGSAAKAPNQSRREVEP